MEKIFQLEIFSGGIKKWKKKNIIISKDEISYSNMKNKENIINKFHISLIKKIIIVQDTIKPFLLIEININHLMKLSTNESNYPILNDIKNILNVKKIEYFINMCRHLYTLEIMKCFNVKEFQINISNYISDSSYNEIKNSFDKNKEKINDLSNRIESKYNQFIDFINDKKKEEEKEKNFEMINFIDIFPSNHVNKNFDIQQITKLGDAYYKLINFLSFIKLKQIINFYKIRENNEIPLFQNKNNENIITLNNHSQEQNENNEGNNNDNLDNKIQNLSNENLKLRDKLMDLLNKNSSIKENFKIKLNKENFKLFFCYKCNNLLKRTIRSDSTCKFDKKCNQNSIFYCRRCKINYCTYCINYQRNLKCSKNHSFFPVINCKDKNYECLICKSKTNIPFYVCSHCNEEICQMCSKGVKEKERTCYICNNELTWKKSIYSQCNKCNNFSHCYWSCYICDFSMCLNCYPILNKKCGGFHELEKINLDEERQSLKNQINNIGNRNNENKDNNNLIMFFNNFELKFFGKCTKCRKTISNGFVFCCLRCMLFLCQDCYKDIE